MLAKNEILLFCQGKQEFGQRALGHRSILANPSSKEIVKKLMIYKNARFLDAFKKSILKEDADKYFLNPKKIIQNI